MTTAERLRRYGVENLMVSIISISKFPHLIILRCFWELPRTYYSEGIGKASIPAGSEFPAVLYPSLPSLNDTIRKNYVSITDHHDIAFPNARFPQKVAVVLTVRLYV